MEPIAGSCTRQGWSFCQKDWTLAAVEVQTADSAGTHFGNSSAVDNLAEADSWTAGSSVVAGMGLVEDCAAVFAMD